MIHSYPDYYKDFSCIAGECEATCCAGWQIVVDEASLKKYKNVTGEFRERIRDGVDFKEGVFCQKEEKRCAFLNGRNLCDMYTALGEEALCETCTRYPRHIEEFENVREHTLSISCPVVARMILLKKEPVSFYSEEREASDEIFDDFDPMFYEVLKESREELLAILQDRSLDFELRAALAWNYGKLLQDKMDEGMLYAQENRMAEVMSTEYVEKLRPELAKVKETAAWGELSEKLFSVLFELEVLQEAWEKEIRECNCKENRQYEAEFMEYWNRHLPEFAQVAEQLSVYVLSTYFCGAVYDEYVASKVKLSVLSVFFVWELLLARWIKNGKQLSVEELLSTAYRYSRELEHSDENLCTMDRVLEELDI